MVLSSPDLDIIESDPDISSSSYAPPRKRGKKFRKPKDTDWDDEEDEYGEDVEDEYGENNDEDGEEEDEDGEEEEEDEDGEEEDDDGEEEDEDGEGNDDKEGVPDLPPTDEMKDIKFAGITRTELRKMQEGLKWQDGDVENPNQMDLRVGRISQVVQHDSDDMLYISEVDIGSYDESRLIATSLKESYKMTDLLNKLVVILCNVIPLDDREIKSKTGMLLLATKIKYDEKGEEIGEQLELLQPWPNSVPGERIYVDGFPLQDPLPPKEEEFFDFVMKDFLVDSTGVVNWRGMPLKIENHTSATITVDDLRDTYCKID
ncbi:aminoacyl tRNA synthase complex-interacting multifunctional protein 1-like [Macrosteles quadrilineatus]|uniref:aminoacyl tRNA synthase complex-interacting multifunctional protein 1-like n=1 Tax=Macrosteles quadrilineatus TaxID=74068 RepID=UPI0023E19F21|nr:aminoacyl tRNA synthase complex-interacting multifunctional protein 1-like [Macrosteles quadrilineatus]